MAIRKTVLASGPYDGAATVVPSDATLLQGFRGLYIGGAGDVVVEMLNPETVSGTVTFKAVPAGTLLPISVERVLATGTTATLILALR